MREDIVYSLKNAKSLNDEFGWSAFMRTDLMEPDRAADYYHRRIHSLEGLVRKVAEQVAVISPKASIQSWRSVDPRPPVANVLTISVYDQRFAIRDLWPDRFRTSEGTDKDNLALFASAAEALGAFEQTVLNKWPRVAQGVAKPFARAQANLSEDCHSALRSARRFEMHPSRRRHATHSDPDRWRPRLIFTKD